MGRIKGWYLYLAVGLIVFLLFFPLCRQLLILSGQQKVLAEKLEKGQGAAKQLEELHAAIAKVERELASADQVQISEVLQEIIVLKGQDVAILSLVPKQLLAAGKTVVLPLTLELEGSYPALLDTFYKLGKAKLWVIRDFSLEGKAGTIQGKLNLWVPAGGEIP